MLVPISTILTVVWGQTKLIEGPQMAPAPHFGEPLVRFGTKT